MADVRFTQPRDVKGRFAAFEAELRRQLEFEAREYQREVADYIRGNKLRPGDSTGRLERATENEGNRLVTPTTWRVGNPAYLNRSEAKYWRLIEQGSAGLYARGRGFRGTPLKLRPGGFPGGRPFRSFPKGTKAIARQGYIWRGTGSDKTLTQLRVTVKNEIRPMNAYRTVYNQNNWRTRIRRDFEQSVRKGFLR